MSVKSFAEAVVEGVTKYTRSFGIEQAEAEEAEFLAKAQNLSDLVSASTARTSLGLGTAAIQASSAFDSAGTAASAVAAATAAIEAAAVGPWEPLTLNASCEAEPEAQTPGVRWENFGKVIRLRGCVITKTGTKIASETAFATMPEAFHKLSVQKILIMNNHKEEGVKEMTVMGVHEGKIFLYEELVAKREIFLDNVSFTVA
jgi:hypothetical protein